MADGNSKPTRAEVERAIAVAVWGQRADASVTAKVAVEELMARGWLEVAPEPTPEPEDPENWIAAAGGATYRGTNKDDPNRWYCVENGVSYPWSAIEQYAVLYRKVEDK